MPILVNVDVKEPALKIIFGIQDGFKFNILCFIAILLLVAAVVLVIAGILLFVFPSTIQIISGGFSADVSFSVGWPIIIAGILAILAGVVSLGKAVV